jgi:hypothetical protein
VAYQVSWHDAQRRKGAGPILRLKLAGTALLGLAACATGGVDDRWQNRDGRAPSMSESQDCHVQAGRLATARYPDEVVRTSPDGTFYRTSNPDRFAAEIRWYESCLRAKRYVRAPAVPPEASARPAAQ